MIMAMAMLTYSLLEGTTEFDVESRKLISTRFQDVGLRLRTSHPPVPGGESRSWADRR